MTRTVQVQKVYKDKVQELIAVQDAQMHNAGVQVEGDFKTNRTLLITGADKHRCRMRNGMVYRTFHYPTA